MMSFSFFEYALITVVTVLTIVVIILGGTIKKLTQELLETYDAKRSFFILLLTALILASSNDRVYSQQNGENIFKQKCTACHTIGKGKLVGPDLQGVTTRREETWMKRQIKAPDVMIAEKDPIVMQLLQESNNIPMAPLGLSDTEVDEVIAYLKSTEQKASVEAGIPSQYMPTVLISIAVLIGLTLIGLKAARKKVDVR